MQCLSATNTNRVKDDLDHRPMKAVDHFQLATQVFLCEVL